MNQIITLSDGSVLDVARWPLPDGVDDSVLLNRAQLAIAFKVSENTVTKWVGQGMPAESSGSNGLSYAFRLSHCYAWRMEREERLRSDKVRGDQAAQQAALAFLNVSGDDEEAQSALTPAEMRAWAEAEYHRNRAAEQRGDLVRASVVAGLLQELLSVVRGGISALPDFAEAELGLTADATAKLQSKCDQVLIELRHTIERTSLSSGGVVAMRLGDQAALAV